MTNHYLVPKIFVFYPNLYNFLAENGILQDGYMKFKQTQLDTPTPKNQLNPQQVNDVFYIWHIELYKDLWEKFKSSKWYRELPYSYEYYAKGLKQVLPDTLSGIGYWQVNTTTAGQTVNFIQSDKDNSCVHVMNHSDLEFKSTPTVYVEPTKDLNESSKASVGKKFDNGKTQWSLLPFDALEQVVKVLQHGAEQYGSNNWQQLDDFYNRYWNAAMRHLIQYRSRQMDPQWNLSHMAHCACNILFLLWGEMHNKFRTEHSYDEFKLNDVVSKKENK